MNDDRFERGSRSRSRSPDDNSQHPLKISIPQDAISHFNDHEVINKIKSVSGARQISINQSIDPVSYPDGAITVTGTTLSQKISACSIVMLIKIIEELSEARQSDKVSFDIFIADNKLSNLTSQYGQSLSGLQRYANVSIQKRIPGIKERPVRISGKVNDCKEASHAVFRSIFVDRRPSATQKVIKNQYEVPTYRFVVPGEIANELERSNSTLSKIMRTEYNLDIAVRRGRAPLKDSEYVVTISGRQESCIEAFRELITRVHEFSETFKLVVESESFLCSSSTPHSGLFREIKERVGGDIDIWSDSYLESRLIFISGGRRSKIEALKMLLARDRRRSPERKSPKRESPKRDSPRRPKQSSINITVPEILVARLIGKNGENIRNIMHKSNSNISFMKQEQSEIKTPDGVPARICTLKGTPNTISDGLRILLDQVISLSKH